MKQDITLDLEERNTLGKGLGKLRSEGKIPAVVHDHGKPSLHAVGDHVSVMKVFSEAGKNHPVQVTVGKEKRLALIKDVDFNPVKNRARHVVFQAIRQDEETEAEIPVVFKADAEIPAEKASLMVLKQLDHVEVKALPKDLPEQLEVDPSTLVEVGDHLTVADIKVPNGVTILGDLETQIAIVEMPKDQIAEADAALEEMKAAEAAQGGGEDESDEGEAEVDKTEDTSEQKTDESSKEE